MSPPRKTHCKYGHERTPENLTPHRECRECKRKRERERLRERRQDPEYRKRERERKQDPEYLKRERERKQDPEYLKRDRERHRKLRRDPEYRERVNARRRELQREHWSEYRERVNARRRERYATDVQYAMRSEALIRRWRISKREAQPPRPPLGQLVTEELERRGLAWPTTP